MTIKLDIDLVFDGIEQSGARRADFLKAVKLVKSRQYKSTPQDRAAMLDMRRFSDFLSGGSGGKAFGTPAFDGFYGEPTDLKGYASRKNAPDVELEYEDLERIFGPETASAFTFDEDATLSSRRTIEIKQKQGGGGSKTTFTQLGSGEAGDFRSEIDAIRQQAVIKTKIGSDGKEKVKASLYDQKKLFDWFESAKQTKYRNTIIKIFEQKMQNYLLFANVDGKVKITAVPGLAKIFNLRQSATRRRKLLQLEYTGGATGGSIALRASPAGEALIRQSTIDVTNKMLNVVSQNFLQNILTFYLKGEGAQVLKKTGASTRYGFVNAFAEILLLASEFDPQFGGKELNITFSADDVKKQGSIITKTPIAGVAAKKEKQKSIVQQAVSDTQLTEVARRAFVARMPKDRGQPPVPGILTYRSGRFATSFEITRVNEAAKQITYTYDPVYFVHDQKFKGKSLVESGIRQAVQQVLKTNERFKLVRK